MRHTIKDVRTKTLEQIQVGNEFAGINKKGVKVSSTPTGRSKVIDSANIRKDKVLNRCSISESSSFVYHVTNESYK